MIEHVGQPNLLGFGLTLMGLSVFSFGYVKQIQDQATVICMSLFLRFVQGKFKNPLLNAFVVGLASAILNTSSYSFASLIYPDKEKLESAISMLEATSGIGLIIGPIVGSSIYTAVGFKYTFIILGIVMLPLAFMINCCLRSKLRFFRERN